MTATCAFLALTLTVRFSVAAVLASVSTWTNVLPSDAVWSAATGTVRTPAKVW
jgi:hypothetical protein